VCRGYKICYMQRKGRSLIYHNDSVDSFHDVRLQRRWSFKPTRRQDNGSRSEPTETVGRNTAIFQSTKLFYVIGGIGHCEKTARLLPPVKGEKRRRQNLFPKRR
jgi:hypothetical protein